MDLSNLNNLDFGDLNLDPNNPGAWPLWVKIVAGIALAAAIVGAAYYFDTMPPQEELAGLEKKEDELRADFERKQRKAANLEKLRGKNLACWCGPNADCHADVLLRLANVGPGAIS